MKRIFAIVAALLALTLVLTGCGNNNKNQGKDDGKKTALTQQLVDDAAAMLYEFNKPGGDHSVASSFTMPKKLADYEGFDLDVDWALEGGDGLVTLDTASDPDRALVNVNPLAASDTNFKLTGTVKGGEFSKSVDFDYVIKGFDVADWAFWAENTKDVSMNIKGTVIAKYPYNADNKNTSIFLADADGQHAYFAYRIKCETKDAYDTDLAIGNVVLVNGTTSIYNGFREMGAGCTYTVVTDAAGKPVTAEVKKIAIDDLFDGRADLAAALDPLQAMTVTVSGATIKSIEDSGTRATVTVEKNGTELKIFLNNTYTLTPDEYTEMMSQLAVGYVVDAEGSVAWYNTPQIYPYAGTVKVTSTEVNNADKVSNELNALSVAASVDKTTTIELPVTGAEYSDVSFTYSVTGDGAALDGNKLTLTVGTKVSEVTLKATASCGSDKAEKEFAIRIVPSDLSQEALVELLYGLEKGATLEGPYTLSGVITKVDTPWNEQFSNITVTIQVGDMADKPVQCYRLAGTGAETLKEGDRITVSGNFKRFNDTFEFDAGCKLLSIDNDQPPVTEPPVTEPPVTEDKPDQTVAQILDALYKLEKGEALEGTYTLSGVITVFNTAYNSQYKDVTVTIVVGDFTDKPVMCYCMKGNGVETLKVGDSITVSGTLKRYNDTREFDKDCQLVSIDARGEAQPDDTDKYKTPAEIVNAVYDLAPGAFLDGTFTLTGVITKVDTAYSTQYKNVTVTIVVDNMTDKPIMCYRLAGNGADVIKVGDTITVTGKLKKYHKDGQPDIPEFDAACTLVSYTAS